MIIADSRGDTETVGEHELFKAFFGPQVFSFITIDVLFSFVIIIISFPRTTGYVRPISRKRILRLHELYLNLSCENLSSVKLKWSILLVPCI